MTEIEIHEDTTRDLEAIVPYELTYYKITSVDTSNDTVAVEADKRDRFESGSTFDIEDSTGNDGTYTVSSVDYSLTSGVTTIEVSGSIDDSTADGVVSNADVDLLVGDDETVESTSIEEASGGCSTVSAPLGGLGLSANSCIDIHWKLTDRNGDVIVLPPTSDTLYVTA